MSDYIGTRKQVDEYVGSRLVEAAYLGSRKYYDAYSEVSGSLPLVYESRTEHILKNYALYGTASGAGVETENLFDQNAKDTSNGYAVDTFLYNDGTTGRGTSYRVSEYISVQPNEEYTFIGGYGVSAPSICYYDANHDYLSGTSYNSRVAVTTTAPSDAAYARVTVPPGREGASMLVSGSTAPTAYIPFGYKIPLTDTGENLFDENVHGLVQVSPDAYRCGISFGKLPVGTYTLAYNASSGASMYGLYLTKRTGSVYSTATIYPQSPYSFDVDASVDEVIIRTANSTDTTWASMGFSQCMLVKGSTAPTSYIPYRSSTYPLYIGSTKLGEEEYVDYESGKVYKRTENLFDEVASQLTNGYDIAASGLPDNTTTVAALRVSTLQPIIISENSYTLCYEYDNGVEGVVCFLYSVFNGNTFIRRVAIVDTAYMHSGAILNTSNGDRVYICFFVYKPGGAGVTTVSLSKDQLYKIMLTPGSTAPASYIPYLQPTDPPVPFPAITAYKGENTLSSTETVGTVTVKGRINESST